MNIVRPEHPNPQWERKNWRSLNGEWEFDFDFGKSARERELFKKGPLDKKIIVPFCPESPLSGIGCKDFLPSVCYRKTITLSKEDLAFNLHLHFGAVDFHSFIYINGSLACEHKGGYSSFFADITPFVQEGENTIFVIAEDDIRSMTQPSGKQSGKYNSFGCYYTRTTGIWQSVWLEAVEKEHIISCKYYPDITNKTLTVTGRVSGTGVLSLKTSYNGTPTGKVEITVNNSSFCTQIALSELHLWEAGNGRLYDIVLTFNKDVVRSYFGMREVKFEKGKFYLNNSPLFMRLVLDQGFYPDGICTAKDDEALKKDIRLSKEMGFNGARLHQKVFEKRFLYHCDKEGYIVWGEHGNWGMDYQSPIAQGNFICEWSEILERDFNSPALIGWCPFNETWGYKEKYSAHRIIEAVYKMTKLYDTTRPCIDTSGHYHIDNKEVHDVHDYEQDAEKFADNYSHIGEGIVNDAIGKSDRNAQPYCGEPVFVSEYGGIKWAPLSEEGWGYGNAPKSEDEFILRYSSLTHTLLSNPYITGLCYTQLYDVEQEQNGLYYYDRTPKFDKNATERLKAAMTEAAAIEFL